MREAKIAGSVINISSVSGLNRGQFTGAAAYAASKAALDQLTKVLLQSCRTNPNYWNHPLVGQFSLSAGYLDNINPPMVHNGFM